MPFPSSKPATTTTPAAPVLAVGLKVYVKDPELAQQYPADVTALAGDIVTVALYRGKELKKPANAPDEVVVDVPRAAAFFTPIIGLPVTGYGADAVPATPATTTPATTAPADGKVAFTDVVTFTIPGWTGQGRGGAELLTINGRTARKVVTFEGTDSGLIAEVGTAAVGSASLDKAYCDRVVAMVQFWREQVAKGVHADIGLPAPGQQSINTGDAGAQAGTDTAGADGAKARRGRRTNAEIAAAKAAEAQAAGAQGTAAPATAPQTPAVPSTAEQALIVQRAFWSAIKATAEAELAKIIAL